MPALVATSLQPQCPPPCLRAPPSPIRTPAVGCGPTPSTTPSLELVFSAKTRPPAQVLPPVPGGTPSP